MFLHLIRKTIFVIFIFQISNAEAKVIFAGATGGIGTFLPNGAIYLDPDYYPDATYDPSEAAGIGGIYGIARYIKEVPGVEHVSRVYATSSNPTDMVNWITSVYNTGDVLFMVGYSAGGGVILAAATKLLNAGTPVHVLGLIDSFSPYTTLNTGVPPNVRNAYIYYQKDAGLLGEKDFFPVDPNKTKLKSYLIRNTSHSDIDNDSRVWRTLSEFMEYEIPPYYTYFPPDPCTLPFVSCGEGGTQDTNPLPITDIPGDGTTPWDGYDHDVGLKYVELCKDESDGCDSSLGVTLGSLPTRDIRAKLKKKGGEWKDVDVDYYCSSDREFGDSDDVFLGSKSKELTDSKYDDDDEKSVYLKDSNLSQCVKNPGKYYLFVVVNYDGGKNPSTENDGEEHVRLEAGAAEATVVPSPTSEMRWLPAAEYIISY